VSTSRFVILNMPNDETELMLIMSLGDANQRCSTPHYTNY